MELKFYQKRLQWGILIQCHYLLGRIVYNCFLNDADFNKKLTGKLLYIASNKKLYCNLRLELKESKMPNETSITSKERLVS